MTVEVPGFGSHVRNGPQVASAPGSAGEVQLGDFVDEEHVAARDDRRTGVAGRALEARTERVEDFAGRNRFQIGALQRGARRLRRCGFHRAVDGLILGAPEDSARRRQLLVGEEPGLPVAHRHPLDAVDGAVVVEEEQAHVALAGVAIDVDVVPQGVADLRQATKIGHFTAQ